MMDYKAKRHLIYHAGLLITFIAGILIIVQSLHDLNIVMLISLFLSFFYVVWGIMHHYMHHDIHAKIVIEYILIGMVGISAVYFTLFLLK